MERSGNGLQILNRSRSSKNDPRLGNRVDVFEERVDLIRGKAWTSAHRIGAKPWLPTDEHTRISFGSDRAPSMKRARDEIDPELTREVGCFVRLPQTFGFPQNVETLGTTGFNELLHALPPDGARGYA